LTFTLKVGASCTRVGRKGDIERVVVVLGLLKEHEICAIESDLPVALFAAKTTGDFSGPVVSKSQDLRA
jgi:hypothetical protein